MKMYKIHKRTTKKRKDCKNGSEKCTGQSRNLEGIHISQRLTMPPEFFRTGVAASTSYTSLKGKEKEPKEGKDSCVVDNFHGLFDKCLNIRRSERIFKKSAHQKTNHNHIVGVSGQQNLSNSSEDELNCPVPISASKEDFHGDFNKRLKLNSYETHDILNPHNRDEKKEKHTLKRSKSKSIFDEINHLYTRSSQKFKRQLSNTSQENDFNLKFNSLLLKQINRHIGYSPKTLLACKSKIFSEIRKLENILSGKVKMDTSYPEKHREYYYEQEESDDTNWQYFSKSEWVYRTPEKQQMIPPKLEDNQLLQPAVIYTTKKHTQIFELNSNVGDLSNFEGRNDVAVYNKKFMNHLVTLNNTEEIDVDMDISAVPITNCFASQNAAACCDKAFNFTQTKEKDDFMNVFARPSKKSNRRPLEFSSDIKRKLEEDSLSSRKAKNIRSIAEEKRSEIKKKLRMSTDEFQLNMPKFKLDQPDFRQEVDGGNDFAFMEADSIVGFDFKNIASCSKNIGF